MPTYAFKCRCGRRAEVRRSVDARNLPVKCSDCGLDMEFQFTAPGAIIFKGADFHSTDYPRVKVGS